MKPSNALRREWAARLKASGFVELELPSGDLPAEHRLGEATRRDPNGHLRAGEKAEYYEWALAALKTHRFASKLERCIWTHHANRQHYKHISDMLGVISYRGVDQAVKRISGAIKERQAVTLGNQGNAGKAVAPRKVRQQVDSMVRRMDLGLLLAFVGAAS